MRQITILLALFFTLAALTSCRNNDQDTQVYEMHLGVIRGNTPATFLVETDAGKLLRPIEYPASYQLVDGNRVLVGYYVVNSFENREYDQTVRIDAIQNVLTQNIVRATATLRDTIANDPVQIMNAWIGNDFLNVDFIFIGNHRVHHFYLVHDSLKQNRAGHVALDFHHDANQDAAIRHFRGLISFRINELQVPGADSIQILFRAMDDQFQPLSITYRY